MYRKTIISLFLAVAVAVAGYAAPYKTSLDSLDVVTDTFMIADTVAKDSVKVRDKGFDVRKYLNSSRQKTPAHTVFNRKSFFSNTFIGVQGSAFKIFNPDYGFGPKAAGVIGKWVHPAVGIRLGAGLGYWNDSFDSVKIRDLDLTASVLFNMMSYLGGYNTARFCEMSVVAGAGFSYVWKSTGERGDAFSGHVGLNFDIRVFDRLHLFIEPQLNLYFNPPQGSSNRGLALSSAGDWRSYMTAFNGAVGLTYNFGQTRPETERMSGNWKDPKLDWNGYFVSALGGIQLLTNSRLVWKSNMNAGERIGMHFSFGGGRWFNEYIGLRVSAAYSRNNWVKYLSERPLHTRYVSIRLEGMLDVLNMGRSFYNKSKGVSDPVEPLFGLSILAGPQVGHIMKYDRTFIINEHYTGLTGALQARFRVHKWVSVIAEPRFTIIPYNAPNGDPHGANADQNYYDALMNFNVGLEVRIPSYHKSR